MERWGRGRLLAANALVKAIDGIGLLLAVAAGLAGAFGVLYLGWQIALEAGPRVRDAAIWAASAFARLYDWATTSKPITISPVGWLVLLLIFWRWSSRKRKTDREIDGRLYLIERRVSHLGED
jgi:hypothetical protein